MINIDLNADKEKTDDGDIKIPALNPFMKLFKSTDDLDGKPRWSLYQPASNQYYQINWAEFECLARFHKHEQISTLIEDVNNETTLDIDADDVKTLITFLHHNGLLILDHQKPQPPKAMPAWKKIIHSYLFFTFPIFKPGNFLAATLPIVRPFLGKRFFTVMMVVLAIGIFLTAQRFDEFTHTFLDMLSINGAIITFFVFTAIKIIHEFSHAYVATKHGVNIPHMGVALIVMYPVFYTETTASWQLDSRKKRIEIGLAGIMAELVLASIFLMIWNILAPGIGQSIAFSVVAISLLGSLFVNLNPMMRFDGYFVLSDALNIENLHARAIALARWQFRKTLFGLKDEPPEIFTANLHNFMRYFGFAVIIYRFFLFLGIAILVYTVFLKPLGLFLMAVELLWFIGIPIGKELKVWIDKRDEILKQKRSYFSIILAFVVLIFLALPFHTTISVYGVLQSDQQKSFYSPSPSFIEHLNVQDAQSVQKGDVLAILKSDALEQELKHAKLQRDSLRTQQRRERTNITQYRQSGSILEDKIDETLQTIKTLERQQNRLILTADFDGTIRDLSTDIHENRYISNDTLLFRLVKEDQNTVIAYVNETQLPRINVGNTATFHPNSSLWLTQGLSVTSIESSNIEALSKAELSSLHGGPIPAILEDGQITPLEPTYAIKLNTLKTNNFLQNSNITQKGQIRIKAKRESTILSFFKRTLALIIRESGLN